MKKLNMHNYGPKVEYMENVQTLYKYRTDTHVYGV